MGEMRRAIFREEQERAKVMEEQKRMTDRFASTLVIAASIIAAVRLARGAGHRQAIASSYIRDYGHHPAGKNDTRENRALDWREDRTRLKLVDLSVADEEGKQRFLLVRTTDCGEMNHSSPGSLNEPSRSQNHWTAADVYLVEQKAPKEARSD